MKNGGHSHIPQTEAVVLVCIDPIGYQDIPALTGIDGQNVGAHDSSPRHGKM